MKKIVFLVFLMVLGLSVPVFAMDGVDSLPLEDIILILEDEVVTPEDRLNAYPYDPPSDWAREYVARAIDMGLINEFEDQRFHDNITREEYCELLAGVFFMIDDTDKTKEYDETSVLPEFVDTDNYLVRKLADIGLVAGVGNGKFNPNGLLTREQMAVLLTKVIDYLDLGIVTTQEYINFADEAQISDYAKSAVQFTHKIGLLAGVGDNKINPKGYLTREQAIVLLVKLVDIKNEYRPFVPQEIHIIDLD